MEYDVYTPFRGHNIPWQGYKDMIDMITIYDSHGGDL